MCDRDPIRTAQREWPAIALEAGRNPRPDAGSDRAAAHRARRHSTLGGRGAISPDSQSNAAGTRNPTTLDWFAAERPHPPSQRRLLMAVFLGVYRSHLNSRHPLIFPILFIPHASSSILYFPSAPSLDPVPPNCYRSNPNCVLNCDGPVYGAWKHETTPLPPAVR